MDYQITYKITSAFVTNIEAKSNEEAIKQFRELDSQEILDDIETIQHEEIAIIEVKGGEFERYKNMRDRFEIEEELANLSLVASAPEMLQVLGFALADLEGIMPDYDPSGDREHPGWQTIKDIKAVIAKAKGGE